MDVTERVKAEERAAYLAHHDLLTGLPNRAAFTDELNRVFEEARTESKPFAVISLDLDRFKDINDVFGHPSGDALLEEMAKRFRGAVGPHFLARLGGDEFVVICVCESNQAAEVAERLMHTCDREVQLIGRQARASISAGIAVFPKNGDRIETLLNASDAALYRAKEAGRGTFRFFAPEMDRRIHNRRVLAQDLRTALADGEFRLAYQPQAEIGGRVTGFEALLRWEHKTLGAMAPDAFIPIAEENGLIVEIGEWVLRTACSEAAGWEHKLSISVNVSAVQFRHGDLACTVHQILDETGLEPQRLELEITEGVLVHDFARTVSTLRRLKALGVKIAMDDFGTGYSSLSYLQAFPFDRLKIDKSFVSKLETDPHAREIVKAVIGLGRGLNLPVTAEGVENDTQLHFLEDEHCESVQGYLIGRPEGLEKFADETGERRVLLCDGLGGMCGFVRGTGLCGLGLSGEAHVLDDGAEVCGGCTTQTLPKAGSGPDTGSG